MKLEYKNERPFLDLFNPSPEDLEQYQNEFISALLFSKSEDWVYEKEWRMLLRSKEADKYKKKDCYLFKIPVESVKSVILGSRITEKNKSKITKTLKKERYKHIQLKQAVIDPDKYEINIQTAKEKVTVRDM